MPLVQLVSPARHIKLKPVKPRFDWENPHFQLMGNRPHLEGTPALCFSTRVPYTVVVSDPSLNNAAILMSDPTKQDSSRYVFFNVARAVTLTPWPELPQRKLCQFEFLYPGPRSGLNFLHRLSGIFIDQFQKAYPFTHPFRVDQP